MAMMKRKDFRRVRVGLIVLALCLVVSAIPFAVNMFAPTVRAVNVSSWNELKNNIQSTGNGATLNVTVTGNISLGGFSEYIDIKSGATINLTINSGVSVTMSTDSPWGNAYGRMFYLNSGSTLNITGEGTLNLNYSKTGDSSANKYIEFATNAVTLIENNGGTVNVGTMSSSTGPTLQARGVRNYDGVDGDSMGVVFMWATTIWNRTTASKTNIYSGKLISYAEGTAAADKADWTGNDKDGAGMRCFAWSYGVLDGTVLMNGGEIDAYSECQFNPYDNVSNKRRTFGGTLAYGMISDHITMLNGYVHSYAQYDAKSGRGAVCDDAINGSLSAWSLGLAYWTDGCYPVLEGGQITTAIHDNEGIDNWNQNNRGDNGDYCNITYAVAKTPAKNLIMYTPDNYHVSEIKKGEKKKFWDVYGSETKEFRWKASGSTTENNNYIALRGAYSGYPSAGYATDYNGRISAQMSDTAGTAYYGAQGTGTKTKTLYAYRYYKLNSAGTGYTLDKVQASPDTSINSAVTTCTNVVGTSDRTTTATTFGGTVSGGDPVNTYKWELKNVHYATHKPTSFTISVDQDAILRTSFPGDQTTEFNTFDTTDSVKRYAYFGATHEKTQMASTSLSQSCDGTRVYIFFDYYEQPVETLSFDMLRDGSFEYDAEALTKEDLKLTLASGGVLKGSRTFDNNSGAGYPQTNILDASWNGSSGDANKNENKFSYYYSGTRADGTTISEQSGLPTDAGQWTIRYQLNANSTTNRAACGGTFGVTITPATPGFVDKTYTITYSTPLNAIPLYNTGNTGIAEASVSAFLNDFDYSWGDENTPYSGTTLPTVAQSGAAFKVVATPKSGKAHNYSVADDDFNVTITVNPLKVAVVLSGSSVVYGADYDPTNYISATPGNNDFTVHGAATNGNALTGTLKTELVNAVKNKVQVRSGVEAIDYTPGSTVVGSYTMTLSQTYGQIAGSNFYINSVNNDATLSVTPRNMTVYVGPTGTAANVEFRRDPVTNNVISSGSYTFTASDFIIEGIDDSNVHIADVFGTDYSLANVTYNYPNGGNVGAGEISLPDGTTLTLSGTKASCYTISTIICRSMTITKAMPDNYVAPVIASAAYDPLRTLADVAAENAGVMSNASGSFVPKYPDLVPDAGNGNYIFTFTPADTANYETVDVTVTVPVTKRTVTVTGSLRESSVTYGSPAPSAADYKWEFSGWTGRTGTVTNYLTDNGGYILMNGNLAGIAPSGYGSIRLTSDYTPTTDANTTLTVKVDGTFGLTSNNYNFVFTGTTFTVDKKTMWIAAPDVEAFYGDEPVGDATQVRYLDGSGADANEIPGAAELFGGQSIIFKFVRTNNINGAAYQRYTDGVGTYFVFATYGNKNLTNYNVEHLSGTLTVSPKQVWLAPQDITISYTDDAPTEFTFLPEDSNISYSSIVIGESTFAATTNYTKGDDVGTYTITATCAQDGSFTAAQQPDLQVSENYDVRLRATAILTVQKATIPTASIQSAIDSLGALTYVYDADTTLEQAQRAADMTTVTFDFNGIPVTGSITYARAQSVINVSESGSGFAVYFAATGENADNFNPVSSGLTGAVTVTPKTITGTLQLGGQLMLSGHIYPDLSGVNPSNIDFYTYAWEFADDPGTVISTRRNLLLEERDGLVFENRSLKLTVTVRTVVDNYVGSLELITGPVSPALPTLSASWIVASYENSVVYDAQEHFATVAFDEGRFNADEERVTDTPYTGEFTVKYNGETTVPVDVGTYVISYDATSDGVYASEYGAYVGTMVITPRDLTVSFAVNDKVYDGTTKATFVTPDNPAYISDGLCEEDEGLVELNTRNARVAFDDYNCGDAVDADLVGVYLLGEKAANYNMIEVDCSARITPAPVTAAAGMKTPIVDYSDSLADSNASGLVAYFYNITGVMSRDRSTFRIANDTTVGLVNPAAGVCNVDMSTVSAVGNNNNYSIEIVTDALTVTVNKITSPYIAAMPAGLVLETREYDSKKPLTNEELQTYIAGKIGNADEAGAFTWALVDGELPVPEVSNTGSPKQYTVNYVSENGNYRTATLRVAVPVTAKPITLSANSARIKYGDPVPELTYSVSEGALYDDETILSIFGSEPIVTTTYTQYSPVNPLSSPYHVTVNASLLRNNNYVITTSTGRINVTKASLTATAQAEDKTYNGVANDIVVHFSELNGVLRDSDDVYLPTTITGMVANPDAGRNKTVSFTVPALQGAAAGNYSLTITNRTQVRITINKASLESSGISYSFPTGGTIEYGQSVGQAILDGGSGDGTFEYVLANDVPVTTGTFNSYEMRFTPTDSTNYDSVTQIVPLTVNTAYLKIEPVLSGGTYIGDTLTVTVPNVPSAMLQYITFTWYREDENGARQAIVDAMGTSYTLTSEDVDSRIVVVIEVSSDSPYQPNESSVFEVISSYIKEVQMTFWQRLFSWWARLIKAIQTIFRGRR